MLVLSTALSMNEGHISSLHYIFIKYQTAGFYLVAVGLMFSLMITNGKPFCFIKHRKKLCFLQLDLMKNRKNVAVQMTSV